MNLLFDLLATQPFGTVKRHGGGKYAEVIFRRMVERNIAFSCVYNSDLWILPEIISICKNKNIPLLDLKFESLTNIIKNNKIDVIYSALPGSLGKVDDCRIIGTIHGLRDFETPFDTIFYSYHSSLEESLKFSLKRIFAKAYHARMVRRYHKYYFDNPRFNLVTVSEHSYFAFLTYFPELKDKNIKVFYSPNTSNQNKLIRKPDLHSQKYFLLVSGKIWRKNNLRAIMAFDRLVSYGLISGFRMKVTGATQHDFNYKIKNPEAFDFLGYVDDPDLEELYANAHVFVYPSLNEGFGYPPIEAMRYGVPIIASPFTSIVEICGSGALYFNPYSVEEIMNRMLMILNSDTYERFSYQGLSQYQSIKKRQDADLDALINYIIQN